MKEKTDKEIRKSLERQTKRLFTRGMASEKDKILIDKWIEKFVEMCCEETNDASD